MTKPNHHNIPPSDMESVSQKWQRVVGRYVPGRSVHQKSAGYTPQRHRTPPGQAQPVPPTTTQQTRMRAIANSAAFHFGFIEQGGSSLYPTMALKATDLEVLRIVLSIGGANGGQSLQFHSTAGFLSTRLWN